jgi:hypothetical protein
MDKERVKELEAGKAPYGTPRRYLSMATLLPNGELKYIQLPHDVPCTPEFLETLAALPLSAPWSADDPW